MLINPVVQGFTTHVEHDCTAHTHTDPFILDDHSLPRRTLEERYSSPASKNHQQRSSSPSYVTAVACNKLQGEKYFD